MYRVLYRKYRPASFADVWGQQPVTEILKKQLTTGRIAHAYLFTGSRGIGKTTCAKILAKAVNCLHPIDGDPCNECEICRGIDDETITEVVEMDAASNNGVGDVRDLQERLNFPPTRAKYRVYIIDEVHMMSQSAFNALLKTLEEPPEQVIFILATTEVHQLPATILSRCQRLDFRRISAEDIAGRLDEIALNEGGTIDESAAMLIGKISDGGMRDAISLLDQCLIRSQNVDEDIVREVAGLSGNEHILKLSKAISEGEQAQLLVMVNELHAKSKDMQRLCEELISHYRTLMIINTVKKPEKLIVATTDQLEELKADAKNYSQERVIEIIDILQTALGKMNGGADRRTEIELALMKLCRTQATDAQSKLEKLEHRLAALEKAIASGAISATPSAPVTAPPPPSSELKINALSDNAVPFTKWTAVIETLEGESQALYALLSGTQAYVSENFVLIDTGGIGLDALREPHLRTQLKNAILTATGENYNLSPYKPTPKKTVIAENSPASELLALAIEGGIAVASED